MVRFLNPKSLLTMLMITDKLNVDKANNQTYNDIDYENLEKIT